MRTHSTISISLLFLTLFTCGGLKAQIEEFGLYQDTLERFQDEVEMDSSFFRVYNRFEKLISLPRLETDSALNFWMYDPAYKGRTNAFSLGNTGSPSLPAYPDFHRSPGFDLGIGHLDHLRMKSDSINFYQSGKAYTFVSYDQAPQQSKSSTHLRFGRSFFDNSSLSIIYDRINDEGEYANQKVRSTNLGVGAYFNPKPDTRLFFSFLSNQMFLQENGGITSKEFFGETIYEDRRVYPVHLATAAMEFKEREARLNIYKDLTGKGDSTANQLRVFYDGRYNFSHYKYFDEDQNEEFYGLYQLNQKGVRAFLEERQLRNQVGLSFNYTLFKSAASTGRFKAGLEHQLHTYILDTREDKLNNLFVDALFSQDLSDRLALSGKLRLALADQVGDFQFIGRANLKVREGIHLRAFIKSTNLSPALLQSKFYSLNESVYDNNWNNSTYNSLGAQLQLSKLGLEAELTNTLATEHIYFSQELQPAQISGSFNILQLRFGLNRKLGIFYSENSITLQTSSDDNVPLPSFMSKHYLGTKLRLFKQRLNLNTGLEAHIIPDFDGYAYFPLIGQFYPASELLEYGYRVNAIFAFEVDQFRMFIRYDNLSSIWNDNIQYLIENYPQFDARLRFGVRWIMRG